jgi:hypothetical protein
MLALYKLLAACLLVVFAALAMADTYVCPDGCESKTTSAPADRSHTSTVCVFCAGGAVVHTAGVLIARLVPAPFSPAPPVIATRQSPADVPDHPPRAA